MGKFDGKTVIIAYAGGGIGKAIAEGFVNEGATVIVQDDDGAKLDGYPGEKFIGDLRNKEDADKLIQFALEKGGNKIDVLVNNEDYVPEAKKLEDLTTEQFIDTIDRNLKTIWHTLAAIYPTVKAQSKISVVNIGSVAGAAGSGKFIDYSAVKAGLYGLTKTVAKEWSRFGGARCNLVNTGLVKFKEGYAPQGVGKKGLKGIPDATNPMGKNTTTPQEIANVVMFLASDDSTAINAAIIDAINGIYTISGE
ncbi:MAG: SDR family NAD(P)-dependent oxidoreductase [Candidatus Helarchaeota archaeon]